MIDFGNLEVWFVTGSQHLYGDETLRTVARHSEEMARGLDGAEAIPVKVVFKPCLPRRTPSASFAATRTRRRTV